MRIRGWEARSEEFERVPKVGGAHPAGDDLLNRRSVHLVLVDGNVVAVLVPGWGKSYLRTSSCTTASTPSPKSTLSFSRLRKALAFMRR